MQIVIFILVGGEFLCALLLGYESAGLTVHTPPPERNPPPPEGGFIFFAWVSSATKIFS